MRETDVIKAKIYDRAGITIFSSDPNQIGENKSTNAGFIAALNGKVASELVHRNSFDSFEGTCQTSTSFPATISTPAK